VRERREGRFASMRKLRLVDADTGRCLLRDVVAAQRLLPRFLGLMGRRGLPAGSGLYLPRCSSIHMFFMRFPIDVVYLADGVVKKVVDGLRPWRISWCPGADSVLEAPAGWARRVGLRTGARLRLEERTEAQQ